MPVKRAVIKAVMMCAAVVISAQADWIPGTAIVAPSVIPESQEGFHNTPLWQILGNVWGENDGVSWSIDNGATFGTSEIIAGQDVIFKFDMYKELWGTHTFDALKVWIDDEAVYQNTWNFNRSNGSGNSFYTDNPNDGYRYYADAENSFFMTYNFAEAGQYDLIARVTCSRDLIGSSNFNAGSYPNTPTPEQWEAFTTDRFYSQGERETYRITVKNVPEPTMLSLLGLSLLGLGFLRRRSSK